MTLVVLVSKHIACVCVQIRRNKHFINILCFLFFSSAGDVPDLMVVSDAHVIASLLKLWFRELPEPLLTYELYDCFIAAAGMCTHTLGALCMVFLLLLYM